MRYKTFLTIVLFAVMGFGFAYGQRSEATSPSAALLSGAVSFSSQGGDLYAGGEDEDRLTTLAIIPSLFYFVAPGLGIGGDLSYNRQSQGNQSLTIWGAGPKLGYFMDSGSNTIPFLAGGINFLSIGDEDDSESGFRFKIGGGVLLRKDHMALRNCDKIT